MATYNKIHLEDTAAPEVQAMANAVNTASRPGPLTTEWWTVLVAGALSSTLSAVGLPGSAAAQVAAIVAPIVLALTYAFIRAQTKGSLASALTAVFPQATPLKPPTTSAPSAQIS
jgi:hypothetical protein